MRFSGPPQLALVYELFEEVERQPAGAAEGIWALLQDLHAIAIRPALPCASRVATTCPASRPTS
jgi:hypothetical protein